MTPRLSRRMKSTPRLMIMPGMCNTSTLGTLSCFVLLLSRSNPVGKANPLVHHEREGKSNHWELGMKYGSDMLSSLGSFASESEPKGKKGREGKGVDWNHGTARVDVIENTSPIKCFGRNLAVTPVSRMLTLSASWLVHLFVRSFVRWSSVFRLPSFVFRLPSLLGRG